MMEESFSLSSYFPSSKKLSIRKRAIVVDTFTRGLKMQGAGPSLSRKRKGWEKILRFNCKTERNNENIYIYEGRRIGTMERFAGKKSRYCFKRVSVSESELPAEMGRICRSRESVGKFVKSSPLERPKNRYRSFSFWNLSFNDGSRLWRQAPGVTRGQKGANKFSKVSIVPYIYIYISRPF